MTNMKVFNKGILIQYDSVNSEFDVSVHTDLDGTIWSQKAKSIKDVLYLIGKITKTKIDFIE